ncbi:MAG: hypothetical protein FRX49_12902 [Trebouxia sp. A1-2]|nr:MAG: hypothetical protein FRX49_12902 [Trebouxia sp. A1-2]
MQPNVSPNQGLCFGLDPDPAKGYWGHAALMDTCPIGPMSIHCHLLLPLDAANSHRNAIPPLVDIPKPAVAMPLPMSPPPMTATLRTLRGFNPASVTPDTFLVERWAKKICTRALWASKLHTPPDGVQAQLGVGQKFTESSIYFAVNAASSRLCKELLDVKAGRKPTALAGNNNSLDIRAVVSFSGVVEEGG